MTWRSTAVVTVVAILTGAGVGWAIPWQRPAPCPNDVAPRSERGGKVVAAKFFNRGKSPVLISWMAPEGYEVLYGQIDPGKSVAYQSFDSYKWLIRNVDGSCIAAVNPIERYYSVAGKGG
ncbi:hypothetical protein HFO42_23940 [Rhizobium leguminosarum]|uniref:von Hippel-Lindau disease tumour suppressor beta domain-containing protein n=1 Tax=Rhizobium leguminosarum TaxID=384 RepID=A0AAJ1ABZ2_RHILE|nr:hypothetical protein [Rhizobium leguminosarum]MBY5597587.1 hypothetical protein [Rhizobium leguminosarum]MBY5617630.1 hypothetical protein [Rhizobium leguminosarum]MBY5631127.1 hypothetical protein [Rhizobium leguminosarum]MBY5713696.1 hypothetical protein [Rhizobium leguminosarum]